MSLLALRALIARDLRLEFSGRARWLMPLVAISLMGPVTAAPDPKLLKRPEPQIDVMGDVPEAVAALPNTHRTTGRANLWFVQEGTLLEVKGTPINHRVRAALDDSDPSGLRSEVKPQDIPVPPRGALIALIATSLLTGSLAQSLPGERSHDTLVPLLSTALPHWLIVTAKVLAWGGLGALVAWFGAFGAVLLGNAHWGGWMWSAGLVPLGAAALGLYQLRTTSDLSGGAALVLRSLPVTVIALTLLAAGLTQLHPLLGAAIPLGGSLFATGGASPWPVVAVASVSTLLATGLLIRQTAADLMNPGEPTLGPFLKYLAQGATFAALWWLPILAPSIWTLFARGDAITQVLTPEAGLVAASASWMLWIVGRALTTSTPHSGPRTQLQLQRIWVLPVAIALMVLAQKVPSWSWTSPDLTARLQGSLFPTDPSLGALAAVVVPAFALFGPLQWPAHPAMRALVFIAVFGLFAPLPATLLAVAGLLLFWVAPTRWTWFAGARLAALGIASILP